MRTKSGWLLMDDEDDEQVAQKLFTLTTEKADHHRQKQARIRDEKAAKEASAEKAAKNASAHFAKKEEAAFEKAGLTPRRAAELKKAILAKSPYREGENIVYEVPGNDHRPSVHRRIIEEVLRDPFEKSQAYREQRDKEKQVARGKKKAKPSVVPNTRLGLFATDEALLQHMRDVNLAVEEAEKEAQKKLDSAGPQLLKAVNDAGDDIVGKVGVRRLYRLLQWRKALPPQLKARNADAGGLVVAWSLERAKMGEEEIARLVVAVADSGAKSGGGSSGGGRGGGNGNGKGKAKAAAPTCKRKRKQQSDNSDSDDGDSDDEDDDHEDVHDDDDLVRYRRRACETNVEISL